MGRVMDPLPRTSYVSRVVALPPDLAGQVFDACQRDGQHRSADPSRWTLAAGPTSIVELHGPGERSAPEPSRSWVTRSIPGVLRTGRPGRPSPVELELVAWSSSRAELGLRPVGRRAPSVRYLTAAVAAVEALASELELRGLLALHPSHVTGPAPRQEVATSAWL